MIDELRPNPLFISVFALFRYYYDFIRIHSENEQLMLPVHAYPVLNRENIREVFPKLIDFKVIDVGSSETMVKPFSYNFQRGNVSVIFFRLFQSYARFP